MDRKTYIDTVLSTLRRVTGDEKLAIRAELDGHIEDHMEGLLELGYDPALAEERTLAAMGDPGEPGGGGADCGTVHPGPAGPGYPGESLGQCMGQNSASGAGGGLLGCQGTAGYPGARWQRCGAGLWGVPADPGGRTGGGALPVRL